MKSWLKTLSSYTATYITETIVLLSQSHYDTRIQHSSDECDNSVRHTFHTYIFLQVVYYFQTVYGLTVCKLYKMIIFLIEARKLQWVHWKEIGRAQPRWHRTETKGREDGWYKHTISCRLVMCWRYFLLLSIFWGVVWGVGGMRGDDTGVQVARWQLLENNIIAPLSVFPLELHNCLTEKTCDIGFGDLDGNPVLLVYYTFSFCVWFSLSVCIFVHMTVCLLSSLSVRFYLSIPNT